MSNAERLIDRQEFDEVCEALWGEIQYINTLPRRTADEAKDVPGFLSLARVYIRRAEDTWADNPGVRLPPYGVQVPEALHCLRKVTGIMVRAMIYNGVLKR